MRTDHPHQPKERWVVVGLVQGLVVEVVGLHTVEVLRSRDEGVAGYTVVAVGDIPAGELEIEQERIEGHFDLAAVRSFVVEVAVVDIEVAVVEEEEQTAARSVDHEVVAAAAEEGTQPESRWVVVEGKLVVKGVVVKRRLNCC